MRKKNKKKNKIEVDQDIIIENVTELPKEVTAADSKFLKDSFKHHFTLESLSESEA